MARTPHRCGCSPLCDATTGRSFAPGHDARMVSRLAAMVVSDQLSLEDAAQLVHQAGGTVALISKLVARVAAAPVRWTRVTEVTVFSEQDRLAVQFYQCRTDDGLPPWVLLNTSRVGEDAAWAGGPTFWSVSDAIAWQAKRQTLSRLTDRDSVWKVWGPLQADLDPIDPNIIETWSWLK